MIRVLICTQGFDITKILNFYKIVWKGFVRI